MKKRYGVLGSKGKLGSLLSQREGFVALDADITDVKSIRAAVMGWDTPLDVLVNCAGISSIDECQRDEKKAFKANVRGLSTIHSAFGTRVLNVGTDQVFSGTQFFLQSEGGKREPVNVYGFSKLGAEAVSEIEGGKTIRLSRTISLGDADISIILMSLCGREELKVPSFFFRNYLTRSQAVDGIEYFVNHYDSMPKIVNYGSEDNVSMLDLARGIAKTFGLEPAWIVPRKSDSPHFTPRPAWGGFSVKLAKSLGFPMYDLNTVLEELVRSANA